MKRMLMRAALILTALALWTNGGAYAAEWTEVTGAKETYTIAASADGTRFLMAEAENYVGDALACRAYLVGADGSGETELSLRDSDLVESYAQAFRSNLGISAEAGEALISESGEAGFVLMFMPWRRARLLAAAGDSILLYVYGYGYVLVDAETGEATLLDAKWAGLAADGRLATCDGQGACAIIDPDGSEAAVAPDDAEWAATGILPLSDGGYVVACRSRQAVGLGVYDYDFAYVGADGAVVQAISAGSYSGATVPELFFYSEEAGVGIACSYRNATRNLPLIFRAGDETARVLWMDGADATSAREVAISDVLGAKGALAVDAACILMPLGIARDGKSALVCEMNNGNLYLMDLGTLALTAVATDAELDALFARRETDYQGMATIASLGWNGGDYLTGWPCAPGCALRLGIE